jgi:hypothetical protein
MLGVIAELSISRPLTTQSGHTGSPRASFQFVLFTIIPIKPKLDEYEAATRKRDV